MNRKLVIAAIFLLLFSGKRTVPDTQKVTFLSDTSIFAQSAYQNSDYLEKWYSVLFFELRDDFNPNDIWNEFEQLYGQIDDSNYEFANNFYQEAKRLHYYELKTSFMEKSGFRLDETQLNEATPFFILKLDEQVSDLSDIGKIYRDII